MTLVKAPGSPRHERHLVSVLTGHDVETTGGAKKPVRPKRVLGMASLAMIDIAAVISLRNLPTIAEYGWGSIFIFGLALLGFMIPISFAAAELASGWAETGGVYVWVREAFGNKSGAVAIWADWAENLVWYPTVSVVHRRRSRLCARAGMGEQPRLALHRHDGRVLGDDDRELLGVKASARISSWGTVIGSVSRASCSSASALGWILSGHTVAIPYHGAKSLMPALSIDEPRVLLRRHPRLLRHGDGRVPRP